MAKKEKEGLTLVDPLPIYFTFSRIRPQFSCGRFVKDTLEELLAGNISPADLPSIAVLTDGENLFSLNNRRLFVYKHCQLGRIQVELWEWAEMREFEMKWRNGMGSCGESGNGQRVGLIRFGSRVDVYLPPDVAPLVALGQRTPALRLNGWLKTRAATAISKKGEKAFIDFVASL